MSTGSYLLRRAIYQNSHTEGFSEEKAEMARKSQAKKTGEDSSNVDKKRLDDEKQKLAGMTNDSATDMQ